jgi:hypothetical protein
MLPQNIPDDINIELLLSYFPKGSCKVSFTGMHQRNAYNDFMGLEELPDNTMLLNIGRSSLYNDLPELLFHPIDRFDYLPATEEKERFEEEYKAQEREVEQAHKFFAPIDLMLLRLRLMVRERLNVYAETDKIMIDVLGDEITETQKQNRFIKNVIPFLPQCKLIRGNKTYLTLMLRKVLMEEGVTISVCNKKYSFTEAHPRYNVQLGSDSESLFLGGSYDEQVTTYNVHYWSEDECNENFLQFVEEMEAFRKFVQDYFIALDGLLRFDISCDEEPLRLSDEMKHNYMNYNMNI